ncbi:hypothetical protein J6590_000194 [Homalodisca vitripennis]|nr:hypothetical protein J6590_000194 [Homalodisca vitripennis]
MLKGQWKKTKVVSATSSSCDNKQMHLSEKALSGCEDRRLNYGETRLESRSRSCFPFNTGRWIY